MRREVKARSLHTIIESCSLNGTLLYPSTLKHRVAAPETLHTIEMIRSILHSLNGIPENSVAVLEDEAKA
jgi:hypothetical protein